MPEPFAIYAEGRPSEEMAAIMARLAREDAGLPDPAMLPPTEGRVLTERINARWNVDLPQMARVAELTIPGDPELGTPKQPARGFTPPNAAPGGLLYLHGGGWAFCSASTHERAIRALALACGLPVLAIEYRLAPEDPFPSGLMDCVAAWRAMLADPDRFGLSPGPLLVAGDSAGANLALALMLHEIERDRPLPDGALLFYGVYGDDFESPSYRRFGEGFGLTREKVQRYWDWYAPAAQSRGAWMAAPLSAPDAALRALPPLLLNAAGLDPLLCDTLRLAERLAALGRRDELHVYPGVVHGFMQMTSCLAAARQATADAGAACRRMIRYHATIRKGELK